jgi:hypothetical protein
MCDGKDILVYNNNYKQQFIRLYSYRFYGLCWRKSQKNVRLRYCDGKDKYLQNTVVKEVENIYFW